MVKLVAVWKMSQKRNNSLTVMEKKAAQGVQERRRNAIWRAPVKWKVTVTTKKSHREIPPRKRNTENEAMKDGQRLKNSCTNYTRTVMTTWSLQRDHTLWNNCKKIMLRKIWREEAQKKFLRKYWTKIIKKERKDSRPGKSKCETNGPL